MGWHVPLYYGLLNLVYYMRIKSFGVSEVYHCSNFLLAADCSAKHAYSVKGQKKSVP